MGLKGIGLLSPGDMGHVIGERLIGQGLLVFTCLEGRSKRTRALAAKACIKNVSTYSDLVEKSDLILSVMVPGEAVKAAEKVAKSLLKTGEIVVYVDLNAVAPETGREINNIIRGAGSKYVDASIIGGPPRLGSNTKFYASGPYVNEFLALREYGLDVRSLGYEVGKAKGIKMIYGALTKGLTAISTQLLMAAWKMGLYDALEDLHGETQRVQRNRMEKAVPSMPNRSRRWVSEMKEIAKTYEALGITGKMYEGAAEFYTFIGKTLLGEEKAETMDRSRTLRQVIELLCKDLN